MFEEKFNIGHTKECWKYLKEHFQYSTLNSWNRLYSVANNVKVYNLSFRNDPYKVLEYLEDTDYRVVNEILLGWEREHEGFCVGFNGRSGGYLVLYNKEDNCSILPSYIEDYDTYEDLKEDYRIKDIDYIIREYAELVRDFDKLCDQLVEIVDRDCSCWLESFEEDL